MSRNQKQLAKAFYADAVCEITYRDEFGHWTERTIQIAELHQSHVIAKCELRGNAYRRFNMNRIRRVRPAHPPVV